MDFDAEIISIDRRLVEVQAEIQKLKHLQQELNDKKESLKAQKDLEKSKQLGKKNWDRNNFEWSERLEIARNEIFGIKEFRPQQLSAMNATMSSNHALIVMPTGAGKSLCFQLPAVVSEGITVVVSPLISLMEDQIMSLQKHNVPAKLMTSTSTKEETNTALDDMTNKNSDIKLLYVTPERFAKSKRFMAKLQKCYAEGRLQRIAIDEVHCCSQWGHDFRPDYKFLGILSSMFPNVPIIGLTATATTRVLMDVQKMLDIRGCLIIRSSFNRPSLFYHIIEKPSAANDCLNIFENLLKCRYRNQSGIIYATSIKDCEDIASGLRERGLKVACYHANLESSTRSTIHTKWTQQYYQAIVATVAFGLGIDKPDVRFVLHHSLSKSMESYYQESGRAGRDGERAECIMMYRMQDVFRVSTMVFSNSGSLEHLYGMVRYCLNSSMCRRKIIAGHFDEDFGRDDCQKMCDRCCQTSTIERETFIENYCRDLYKIISWSAKQDTKVTAQKLIDAWFGKGAANLRVQSVSPPKLTRLQGENIVAFLLIEGYLREDFHFTAYSTISYLKVGAKSHFLEDSSHKIQFKTKGYAVLNDEALAPVSFPKPKNHSENRTISDVVDKKENGNSLRTSKSTDSVKRKSQGPLSNSKLKITKEDVVVID